VDGHIADDGSLAATIEGRAVHGRVLRSGGDLVVILRGRNHTLATYDPVQAGEYADTGARDLRAPMPGKLIQVLVKPGDHARRGQPVAILEAMKMEHTLSAPIDAVIEAIHGVVGDQVAEGAIIATFAAEADATGSDG
jgi:3-methylcrotonyl-CoA carboxylase alpha subunit